MQRLRPLSARYEVFEERPVYTDVEKTVEEDAEIGSSEELPDVCGILYFIMEQARWKQLREIGRYARNAIGSGK